MRSRCASGDRCPPDRKGSRDSIEELKELNPELLRWCTPPDSPYYEMKVPVGKKDLFLRNFEAIPSRRNSSSRPIS